MHGAGGGQCGEHLGRKAVALHQQEWDRPKGEAAVRRSVPERLEHHVPLVVPPTKVDVAHCYHGAVVAEAVEGDLKAQRVLANHRLHVRLRREAELAAGHELAHRYAELIWRNRRPPR